MLRCCQEGYRYRNGPQGYWSVLSQTEGNPSSVAVTSVSTSVIATGIHLFLCAVSHSHPHSALGRLTCAVLSIDMGRSGRGSRATFCSVNSPLWKSTSLRGIHWCLVYISTAAIALPSFSRLSKYDVRRCLGFVALSGWIALFGAPTPQPVRCHCPPMVNADRTRQDAGHS